MGVSARIANVAATTHPITAASASASQSRTITTVAWDTLFQIGGIDSDTTLLDPRMIVARDALYVFDTGDRRLKAFDMRGRSKWTFGGPGQGPGEFENVVDLEIDGVGDLWVSDGALGRATVVSPSGEQRRHFTVQNATLRHIAPINTGLVSTQVQPSRFLAMFDKSGKQIRTLPPPRDDIRDARPTARQAFTAVAADGRSWAVLFPFASPLVAYRDESVTCIGQLVEGGPFQVPQSGLRPDIWAVSVAVSDSTIYVLPRGKTENAFKILDEYSLRTCRYRRSVALPRKAIAVAVNAGTFWIAFDDPAPGVIALRLQSRR